MTPDPTAADSWMPAAPAARRFAFLARAGEVFSSSLDYAQTLQHVAQLAVPELGDLCLIDVIEDGQARRVGAAHVNPDKHALLERLARDYPAMRGSPSPAARVLDTGRVEIVTDLSAQAIAEHTVNAEHERLIHAIGMRSVLAVPMTARGVVIGAISLAITETDRRYAEEDIALVDELARRAALAVDNARLYGAAQDELAKRREFESQLRLSERRFRAIMEQSPLSTQILAPDGTTTAVNGAFERLWQLTLADLAGYNVLGDAQLHAKGIAPLLRRAFHGETVELPVIAFDTGVSLPDLNRDIPAVRWVSAFAYPLRDDTGAVREVVLIHRDITEARKAELDLRHSEDRLRRALVAGQLNVWDWNLETDVVECSENATAFWGIHVGRAEDFLAVIHPDDLAAVAEASRAAIAGERAYELEYRLRAGDDRERWVNSRAQVEYDANGRAIRILGVTQDVSARKRAEEATRMLADAGVTLGSSLDYQATLASLAHVVVPRMADWYAVDLLNEDGTLKRVSVMHSDPARMVLARELAERYPPLRDPPSGPWRTIETGEADWLADITDEQLQRGARDAEHLALLRQIQLRSYISVPLIARGATIGVMTLVYADSGRRYTQDDVDLAWDLARRAAAAVDNARLFQQLQDEDRRKNEFLATLAHELRNPLAPVRTGLTLLQSSPDVALGDRTRRMMDRQLAHMVRLIDDLLDLSRVTRGTIELRRAPLEIASVVQSAVEASQPLLDAAGVRLSIDLPPDALLVDGDHTRLAQVMSNLLNNAAKFTPRGGNVAIVVRADGDDVRVEVEDDGVGIAQPQLEQVFRMFSRAGDSQAQGLGIGLTLVRRLVELHGGKVWAESDGIGRGSRFIVRLPGMMHAPPLPTQRAHDTDVPQSVRHAAQRVLVVDDNEDAADTLVSLLELHGHDARSATNARDALALARAFAPQLAFLDIGLPGMNGHDLARAFRSDPALADTRLVALTGWGRKEDQQRSRDAGFDQHLTKPVDPQAVLALAGQTPNS